MSQRTLVISCHADTGFFTHAIHRSPDGTIYGELDNFIGVHCLMTAYFSGRLDKPWTRIELTYGEEEDFDGAREVFDTLNREDVVLVIDVTGTRTKKSVVFEKCKSKKWQQYIHEFLSGDQFDLYDYCPDPVADEDETDVYSKKCQDTCFLGIPVWGGDYNEEKVYSNTKIINDVVESICVLVENFDKFPE